MTFALILSALLVFSFSAYANPACAVCTVAVGASLEIARQLGVDDSVVGVWSGALMALVGFWLIKYFDKKGWNFYGRDFLLLAISVGSIGFVYLGEIAYTPKVLLGFLYMDPFLFSAIAGALVFIWSSEFYQWMKRKNGGHAHFPFEKVAVPVAALALVSWYFSYIQLCSPANDLLSGF